MNWLGRMQIRQRLWLVLCLALLGLALVGGFAAHTIALQAQRAAAFIDTEFQAVQVLANLRAGLGLLRQSEKDVFLHMGVEEETNRYSTQWHAAMQQTRQDIVHTRVFAQGEELQALQTMDAAHTHLLWQELAQVVHAQLEWVLHGTCDCDALRYIHGGIIHLVNVERPGGTGTHRVAVREALRPIPCGIDHRPVRRERR